MTPEMITAISGLLVALLGSIGTLYVAIQNGRKTTAAAAVAVETANKSKKTIDEVHVLVNGGLTEQKKEIARLSAIIAGLSGTVGDESHAATTADQAKDSIKLSKDMMDKLPNG